jgi:hypothetical protein
MREGMLTAEVGNEGLLAFLYDLSNREKIAASGARILSGFDADAAADPALSELTTNGLLAVYELPQDDPIRLGVIVGAPLSAKEKKGAKWHKTQSARIYLPSGKLCVDSYNSLRLAREAASVPGATLGLPPGDYALSLHRVDAAAPESAAYVGPPEIVTLEPAKSAPRKSESGVLAFGVEKRAPWDGRYKLSGSEFQGELVKIYPSFPAGTMSLNLGAGPARRLGLQRGARLEVGIGGERFDVFYHAELNPQQCASFLDPAYFESARNGDPALLRGWLDPAIRMDELRGPAGFYRQTKILRIMAWDKQAGASLSDRFRPLTSLPSGTPVSVRVCPAQFAPPADLSWADRWDVSGGTLRAEVLLSKDYGLWLNADESALRKFGFNLGHCGELELSCGGQTRRVIDKSGRPAGELEAKEERLPGAFEQKPLTISLTPHWDLNGRFVITLTPFFFRKYAVGLPAAPGTPVELRITRPG